MKPITELHDGALEATRVVVAGIGEDRGEAPTPCDEWNVRELLAHVVSGNLWAAELAAGKTIEDVGDAFDGDVLGDDPVGAYDRSAKLAGGAFKGDGVLEQMAAVSYGPVPNEAYCGHRFLDTLVHGWDLAVATGQSRDLDPALVDGAIAVLEPQLELLQASGAFATDVAVPDGADDQTKLLAWMGRRA